MENQRPETPKRLAKCTGNLTTLICEHACEACASRQEKRKQKRAEARRNETPLEAKQEARRIELTAQLLGRASTPKTESRWVDGVCVWEERTEPDGARYVTEKVQTAWGGSLKVRKGPFYDKGAAPSGSAAAGEKKDEEVAAATAGQGKHKKGKVSRKQEEEEQEQEQGEEEEEKEYEYYDYEADPDNEDARSTSSQETVRPCSFYGRRASPAVTGDDEDWDESEVEDIWLKLATREAKGKQVLRRVENHI
ncbi:hypothetical protein F4810DRAFT_463734, partial [Camillea tinctor]